MELGAFSQTLRRALLPPSCDRLPDAEIDGAVLNYDG